MTTPAASRIILVAGVPRSGSTWAFNAARRLLAGVPGGLQAAWVADYDPSHPARTHLVKAHRVADVTFAPDLVLTTRRAAEECLASLIRMGWLADEPEAIRRAWEHHHRLYAHWNALSGHEISYDGLVADPEAELARLAPVLGVTPAPGALAALAGELAAMQGPAGGGYDPETLLHPGHRRPEGAPGRSPAGILAIVQGG